MRLEPVILKLVINIVSKKKNMITLKKQLTWGPNNASRIVWAFSHRLLVPVPVLVQAQVLVLVLVLVLVMVP